MAGWLINQVIGWLLGSATDALNDLWKLLAQSLFRTPDVTVLPQVQAINARSLMIVDTSFVLAIITAGVVVMARETVQTRYGIAELAPRLLIGIIAANFATPLCRAIITTANAVTAAVTGEPVASAGSFLVLRRVVGEALANPANQLLVALIGVFLAVLTAMLLVAWIVRLITLIILVGVAPVALACHALPFTEAVARLWWRAVLGVVAVVVLQALALHTTVSVLLDPQVNRAGLGMPDDRSGLFNLFVVVCMLWLTVRIPGLVRRYALAGGGRNPAGYVLRFVVLQQLTRGLGRGLRTTTRSNAGAAHGGGVPVDQAVIGYWRPRLPKPTPGRTPQPAGGRAAPSRLRARVSTGWPATPPAAGTPGAVRGGTGWPPEDTYRTPFPRRVIGSTGWPESPPARRLAGTQRSGTGWPPSTGRRRSSPPLVADGVTPRVMPARRPDWSQAVTPSRTRRARPGGGGSGGR